MLLRLAALSSLALVALVPASISATASYQIGASRDLGQLDIPMVDVTDGYTGPPDENGVARWWLGATEANPYSITIDGQELGRITNWTASLKEDPFVTNNINITNTTAFNIVYIASVIMPIPAFAYDEIVFSSVGVTATDSNGDNIMLVDEDGGLAFYRGRVNGVTLLSLTPPAIPITTADCSPTPGVAGCTATSAVGVASQATPAGVANNIEIILR
ncbi:MAG: hypothetical protein ACRD2A_17955, partial [Vicinamibacterales bacterium]